MAKGMKTEVMKAWVKALTSGKYKQTREVLHKKGGGFCCLGVLVDLYLKEKGIENGWDYEDEKRGAECRVKTAKKSDYEYHNQLPEQVMKWAGLKSKDPVCGGHSLVEHNDGHHTTRKTFPKIAELIKKHL